MMSHLTSCGDQIHCGKPVSNLRISTRICFLLRDGPSSFPAVRVLYRRIRFTLVVKLACTQSVFWQLVAFWDVLKTHLIRH